MKYLKNTLVIVSIFTALLLSIKSGYAAEEIHNLNGITPISTKSLEIELNKSLGLKGGDIYSDLKIYQDRVVKDSIKDITNTNVVTVTLEDTLTKGDSYSILSISGVEGSLEFTIGNSLDNHEILNDSLDGQEQGIEKIIIVDPLTVEISFLQVLEDEEFDFKIYKDISIGSMTQGNTDSKVEVTLEDLLEDNSSYVGTVTLFEGSGDKIDIDNGIYDFTTDTLEKYVPKEIGGMTLDTITDTLGVGNGNSEKNEESLEATLLAALEGTITLDSEDELLSGEEEINSELHSAGEDPSNKEVTQLEKIALNSSETPDTGAETWVLITITFIINTFYFLSRRKKLAQA